MEHRTEAPPQCPTRRNSLILAMPPSEVRNRALSLLKPFCHSLAAGRKMPSSWSSVKPRHETLVMRAPVTASTMLTECVG
jgi:hypothetical protein